MLREAGAQEKAIPYERFRGIALEVRPDGGGKAGPLREDAGHRFLDADHRNSAVVPSTDEVAPALPGPPSSAVSPLPQDALSTRRGEEPPRLHEATQSYDTARSGGVKRRAEGADSAPPDPGAAAAGRWTADRGLLRRPRATRPPESGSVDSGQVDWGALDGKVRECLRVEHYSYRSGQTYVAWIRRYVAFHGWRKPSTLEAEAVLRTALFSTKRFAAPKSRRNSTSTARADTAPGLPRAFRVAAPGPILAVPGSTHRDC